MTILDALHHGNIRYAGGHVFDAQTRPGSFLHIEDWDQLPSLLATHAQPYAGSAFISLDAPLPPEVPTTSPAHTWAFPLCVGDMRTVRGAVVVWSSEAIEQAHGARGDALPFDAFNVRRQDGAEEQ